ncbi:hypothetical protein FA95DRAFT_1346644 [Auriscalpium vulgare]|uniref:Uncharacterized protein n=1 Tax=Auriscalpium vulgare TaxID=40419 RepID=A0ACB8RT32_9AGAM|nr:hypothetical protein FA95DRAFT_1346644 [Auriscalpium vulgare]
MDSFSQYRLHTEVYSQSGQEITAFDIDVTAGASEAYDATSPTLFALLPSSSISPTEFIDEQEQQQPVDPWSPPDWDTWIDAQLKLLLLDAEPAPATSTLGVANSFAVDPAILSSAQTGYAVEDATAAREQPPGPAGAPVLRMPLTPRSDSLAAPTSISLADPHQQASAAPATAPAPAIPPGAQALPFPLSFPASKSQAAGSKTRAHPYALPCPRCSFVQENGRSWDLKRHIKTHEGVRKKYVCGRRGCTEVFSRVDAVRRHQKNPNARCAGARGGDV